MENLNKQTCEGGIFLRIILTRHSVKFPMYYVTGGNFSPVRQI